MVSICTFLAIILAIDCCFASKFAMFPMAVPSHFMVMFKLAEELRSRGHEVLIYVDDGSGYALDKPGVKTFPISSADRDAFDAVTKQLIADDSSPFYAVKGLMKMQQQYCTYLLQSSEIMTEIGTADMIIGDTLYPCGTLLADMFSKPHTLVGNGPICLFYTQIYGVAHQPSHIPEAYTALSAKGMTFMEKLTNLGYYFTGVIMNEFLRYPPFDELKRRYGIKPAKSIKESLSTFDLVLLSSDFAIDNAQALAPNVRVVGYILPSPAKPLPADLEAFMQSSGDDGVILVSFGSQITELQDGIADAMATAFAKFSQKVLWKVKLDSAQQDKLAPNIKTVTWLPQNDILGHPKTKLFITHAGINGIAESAYHGVPMVCSPFFADQMDNAQRMKDHGLAEIMPVRTVNTEQLVEVMYKVLSNKNYKQNALRVSRAMKMRKRTPTQEAAELLEYVLAVGNMSYLRPRDLDMPFYEVYMLDVLGVLAIALALIVVVLVAMFKLLVRMRSRLTGGKRKTE